MKPKKATESNVIMTELVFPNDTNFYGNLMGGRLMYWMDTAAAMSAWRHCNAPCVTVSVDNMSFDAPIKLGQVVHIEAQVSRAFKSSSYSVPNTSAAACTVAAMSSAVWAPLTKPASYNAGAM